MSVMKRLELLSQLATPNHSKLLLWVFDGVGGVPDPETGLTELETARLPILDGFAQRAACGAHEPHGAGIATGSANAHMALFGYPPDEIELPRGAVEALGAKRAYLNGELIPAPTLTPNMIAARGNFARLITNTQGQRVVEARRANTLESAQSAQLCCALSKAIKIDGVEVFVLPGKQHRFALVLKGQGFEAGVSDADPLRSGLEPVAALAQHPGAQRTADVINACIAQAQDYLSHSDLADTILLRGIGRLPELPTLPELYGLRCAAIATYPVYRGVAQLVGMEALPVAEDSVESQLETLRAAYDDYDLFFFHIKETDNLSHHGDFKGKVAYFERCDALFGQALKLGFDVVTVTGDHCTPSLFTEHSWHPVPTAMWSPHVLWGKAKRYTERECMGGMLGLRPATDLMPLMLAEARRLKKLGA